jgi:hypothetical protein
MAIIGRVIRKAGAKVGGTAYKMTPARKRALEKAAKASALARSKGASKVSKVRSKASRIKSKASRIKSRKAAMKKVKAKKLMARSEKYGNKADRVERNSHASLLRRENIINVGRRVKLGHYARKSRRLERSAKRLTQKK